MEEDEREETRYEWLLQENFLSLMKMKIEKTEKSERILLLMAFELCRSGSVVAWRWLNVT